MRKLPNVAHLLAIGMAIVPHTVMDATFQLYRQTPTHPSQRPDLEAIRKAQEKRNRRKAIKR